MKNILILTSIERSFYSSVIEYQLIEPFVELSNQSKNKFFFLSLVPISFWFRPIEYFKKYKINRKRIKNLLNKNKISCSFIPIFFPIRNKDFYLRIFWLILYIINSLPILLFFVLLYKINLIHARNYPATLLSFFIKSIFGIKYNFDMRDLYPEKGIEANVFTKNSFSYKLWKFIEELLIKNANLIIVTSLPFKEYVRKNFNCKYIKFIPNFVNTNRFKPNKEKRIEYRKKIEVNDKFVIIHSGAFGTPKDIPLTLNYFLKWQKIKKDAHLVILSPTNKQINNLKKKISNVGIKNYTLIRAEFNEVPYYLAMSDLALHLESMAIATPYCIAVKDGEYLATGLPVIVTPYLKGIAPLIEKYGAGIVIDPMNENDFEKENWLINNIDKIKNNAIKLVKEELSLDKAMNSFFSIYK